MNPIATCLSAAALAVVLGGDAVTIHPEYFAPTDDSMISAENPTSTYGRMQHVVIRSRDGGTDRSQELSAFFRFDVSAITPGTPIQSATLHLYYFDRWSPHQERNLDIHRLTEEWDERTLTYNTQPTFEGIPSDSSAVPAKVGEWMTFDVTRDVIAFVDGAMPNHGWKVVDPDDWGDVRTPAALFFTKEQDRNPPFLEVVTPLTGKRRP
jgi:hypothetical protein